MSFNPSSTIYLCAVPIDNTYQNQIYFPSKTAQQTYFKDKVQKTFTNYLTVRTTRPDGSMISSVRVDCNIDELYNCNYMYYQNANHGTRYFYAFITKLIYINEGTTEIQFETDVFQTWWFDVSLKMSYVEREHSVTDAIGDHITPEKFTFQDYTYRKVYDDTTLQNWGYLFTSTEHCFDQSWWDEHFGGVNIMGDIISGIYQGLYFFYIPQTATEDGINHFLNTMIEKNADCILSITAIPEFNVKNSPLINNMMVGGTTSPAYKNITLRLNVQEYGFDGYYPRNKKLYTSPFMKLLISNHNGDQAEYNFEDFDDTSNMQFSMYGDISVNPSITLIPMNYKRLDENYDFGISISSFPQCSFNTDTYKLWLAKNQFSTAMGAVTGIGEIVAGVAMTSTGAGATVGAGLIAHGATGVLNTINSVYQASREPNSGHSGSAKNNLLTAMKENRFDFFMQTIKKEYARTIDDFFTMYGYQTNKLKYPNISSRPYFNYVKTVGCNITGSIPDNDMQQLKAIFNNGVTFWKSHATVGDYSVNNAPS